MRKTRKSNWRSISPEMRAEILRLRIEERLSSVQIRKLTGISTTSILEIAKDHPLTKSELCASKSRNAALMRQKLVAIGAYVGGGEWTAEDTRKLKIMWPFALRQDIEAAFPGRTWAAISKRAADHGWRRTRYASSKNRDKAHPLFRVLREIRDLHKIHIRELADKMGYHPVYLTRIELGVLTPSWFCVAAWLDALECELTVTEKAQNHHTWHAA